MALTVGDFQEHVGVTRFVQRAIAGEVTSSQLLSDLLDRDVETSGEQIGPIAADRFRPTELQRVGIPPLRGSSHDDHPVWQPSTLSARSLQALGHRTGVVKRPLV